MSARNSTAGKAARRAHRAISRFGAWQGQVFSVRITVCPHCRRQTQVWVLPNLCHRCISRAVRTLTWPHAQSFTLVEEKTHG